MLAPLAERQLRVAEERALDRPTCSLPAVLQRASSGLRSLGRILEEQLRHAERARLARVRELERRGRGDVELVEEDADQPPLGRRPGIERLEAAGVQDELARRSGETLRTQHSLGSFCARPGFK